ncbi:SDR family oxidoreductase [Beijerinckia indica]|uniref:Short-chain dehydrogenase/reductase SDR n=1 Tax=Beijerinckia indica subsp. indica (strain ATCC 9039 / DSM 1715 / NCIMB 8712) TaxID=395963 RepID=B2IHK5_BEII9|nr:SDR family oxidoreductase [Beijerinckia indica]ACB94526.1 short-chain dehydrogenase/reductase SDR [Beijerinckia indica subsp. indica ATCC 9039]
MGASGTGKIALITGAGSGIGRAVALAMHAEGYALFLVGRRLETLDETAAIANKTGAADIASFAADVSDPKQVAMAFEACRQRFGRLDVLFNNAGTGAPPVPLEDLTYDQWRAAVDVNLTGTFLCIQQAFKLMKAQTPRGGRIINNGSISAEAPRPFSAPYTATKHGVTGLTKSASLDGRAYDIGVGQIDIGNAGTDMTQRMAQGIIQPDGSVRAEPIMDVSEAARAVVYMASLPLDANVLFLTVMATKMPFIGRG